MNTQSSRQLQFVAFATGVAAIGGFLFGYDTAVINGANSFLKAHMNLTPAQEGIAGASAILGCIPGAMFAGFLSDKFGRKKMLFLCAILYAVSGLLSAIPNTFGQFLAARLISGLGIGASSMICPVYIAEISPGKWRGRLGTLFQLGIVTGIFLTLFINKVIQGMGDDSWNITTGWRWMLGMEVVPAIAFIALLFAVPESPRWLAHHGNETEARGILEKVGGREHAESEMTAIREAMSREEGRFRELFSGPFFKPLMIAVILMACSQFCGINAIMYYSTKIFSAAGGSTHAAFTSSVWVGLINLAFTFVAIGFVDRAGRVNLAVIQTSDNLTNNVQFDAQIINTRQAQTQVFVRDGQTTVVGGLTDNTTSNSRAGIPILSRIPIIGGLLFGNTQRSKTTSELFLFLTPHIVSSDADVDRLREAVRGGSEILKDVPLQHINPGGDTIKIGVQRDSVKKKGGNEAPTDTSKKRPPADSLLAPSKEPVAG